MVEPLYVEPPASDLPVYEEPELPEPPPPPPEQLAQPLPPPPPPAETVTTDAVYMVIEEG